MLAAIYEGMKLMPSQVWSLENLGSNAASVLLKLNTQADGITQEVSKLHQKIKSGGDIPVQFTRNGKSYIRTFRIQ